MATYRGMSYAISFINQSNDRQWSFSRIARWAVRSPGSMPFTSGRLLRRHKSSVRLRDVESPQCHVSSVVAQPLTSSSVLAVRVNTTRRMAWTALIIKSSLNGGGDRRIRRRSFQAHCAWQMFAHDKQNIDQSRARCCSPQLTCRNIWRSRPTTSRSLSCSSGKQGGVSEGKKSCFNDVSERFSYLQWRGYVTTYYEVRIQTYNLSKCCLWA